MSDSVLYKIRQVIEDRQKMTMLVVSGKIAQYTQMPLRDDIKLRIKESTEPDSNLADYLVLDDCALFMIVNPKDPWLQIVIDDTEHWVNLPPQVFAGELLGATLQYDLFMELTKDHMQDIYNRLTDNL